MNETLSLLGFYLSLYYHFVSDHVAKGSFKFSHIASKDQLVDALMKPLSSVVFAQRSVSPIGAPSCGDVVETLPHQTPHKMKPHRVLMLLNHTEEEEEEEEILIREFAVR